MCIRDRAIDKLQADASMRAIETIAKLAHEMKILIICGGTDMGVMAKIGQVRSQNTYTFPLVGMTLEDLVSWPDGPQSTKFLWWGRERWRLEPHYPYFILVPGSHFGDESPWIVEAASIFSKDNQSVTVLINGGEISRKDIQLSLEEGRPVIALPDWIGRIQAFMMELAPGEPLMSRDNLDSMKVDNVASATVAGLEVLGITPSRLEPIAAHYLAPGVQGSPSSENYKNNSCLRTSDVR